MAENKVNYTEDQLQWRKLRAEEDEAQREFYKKLNNFPNLFSLRFQVCDTQKMQALLKQQETELDKDWHQYHLEKVRCHNLIIFLLYMLGHKQDAMSYCEKLEDGFDKSVIFLTLKAILQWEFNYKQECNKTMTILQDLYKLPEYDYLLAIAESEKGHLLACMGAKWLSIAIDTFQKAIDRAQDSNIYLWKFDIGFSIRKNFNLLIYSEHPQLAPSVLASWAVALLIDVWKNCPNEAYKARGVLELARLIDLLSTFSCVCKEEEKDKIIPLLQQYNMNDLYKEAYDMQASKKDFYIMRECGRWFLYQNKLQEALNCFEKSMELRENSAICQQLGKCYLKMYDRNFKVSSSQNSHGSFVESCDPEELNNASTSSSSVPGLQLHGPSNCVNCQVKYCLNSDEAKRLAEQLDQTPFMDREGNFLTTQADGFGNIRVAPPNTQAFNAEEKILMEQFDENMCLKADESFKTTEPGDEISSMTTPAFQVASPSADNGHLKRIKPHPDKLNIRMTFLMKSKMGNNYDGSDDRIKEAEKFFLKGYEMDSSNYSLLFQLGDLYKRLQKPEEALKYYKLITVKKEGVAGLAVVNAFERSGLCLMMMHDKSEDHELKKKLKIQAEDMFMSSLVECRQRVAHFPKISDNRAWLWESYPEMLGILRKQEGRDTGQLKKEAWVHEVVGEHLKAISVYQKVMELSREEQDWTNALLGTLNNYLSIDNIREAKFILDLFLSGKVEREFILSSGNDVAQQLRHTALQVYRRVAAEALGRNDTATAVTAFRSALILNGKLHDPVPLLSLLREDEKHFDLCIFHDDGSNLLSDIVAILKATCISLFGMRVSINDEGGMLGHLNFEGLLNLAQRAPLVMLVVNIMEEHLSPAMTYVADVAIQNHDKHEIMLINIGDGTMPLPAILSGLRSLSNIELLMALQSEDVHGKKNAVCDFFNFILEGTEAVPTTL